VFEQEEDPPTRGTLALCILRAASTRAISRRQVALKELIWSIVIGVKAHPSNLFFVNLENGIQSKTALGRERKGDLLARE